MSKLFNIYLGLLFILTSILLPLLLPALAVAMYMEEGFSSGFIIVLLIVIAAEPLTIAASYELLKFVKYSYDDNI